MSIERSHVPSSHKPTHGAEASHGKGKTHGAGAAPGGDTGGFSSLLLTLGAQETEGADFVVSEGVATTEMTLPLDPGLLLAQSVQLQPSVPLPDANLSTAAESKRMAAVLPASDALKSKDVLSARTDMPTETETKNSELQTPQADLENTVMQDAALKNDLKELAQAQPAGHKPVVFEDLNKQVKSKLELQAHEQKIKLAESAMTQMTSSQPQLTQVLASGESGLKQAERFKERLALKQAGASEGGAWGYQALAEAGRIQAPVEASATAALPPELMAAEQVRYWINHNVQNAELKFDGLGEGTVKVNISLQGNEATVQFQSDQPETRQILEGAASHLKDMLGNEGLVLSSVSVGTSNSGGADARHSRPALAARQTTVEVAPVRMTEVAARTPRTTGRALDLFV